LDGNEQKHMRGAIINSSRDCSYGLGLSAPFMT